MHNPSIIKTEDGSDTLFDPSTGEHYHSRFGAQSESEHVFINAGFCHIGSKPLLNVLEVGFGSGLNALLTALESGKSGICIRYYGLEKYPLGSDLVEKLHFPVLDDPSAREIFLALHYTPWGSSYEITPSFKLTKLPYDLTQCSLDECPLFDLVYFDAFSPDKQPEMWEPGVLEKISHRVASGGVFVTYSARGSVRRNLAAAGFMMERIAGPKGKREMLRGIRI